MSLRAIPVNVLRKNVLLTLVPLSILTPHEQTVEEHVRELQEDIAKSRRVIKPIIVDIKTFIILDGHHRVEALKRLGKRYVPAILIDYDDECIHVSSWRSNWRVTKDLVRVAGLSGKLLPPKTSRHRLCFEVPEINISIDLL